MNTATDKRRIVNAALIARGHPTLDTVVAHARAQDPPTGWAPLAATVSHLAGEDVSSETLRRWFDPPEPKTAGEAS